MTLLHKLALALVKDDADQAMRLLFPHKNHGVNTRARRASIGMLLSLLPRAKDAHADTVEQDLEDLVKYGPEGEPRATHVAALLAASKYGYTACVSTLLAAHEVPLPGQRTKGGAFALLSPDTEAGFALILACANEQVHVVNVLLNDPRVDVSAEHHTAIKWASEGGNVEIVEMMLKHARVDPSGDNNAPICGASGKGRFEVVKMLLQDARVDPAAQMNGPIRNACFGGHADIAQLLLANEYVDPSADINYALRWACRNGHSPVVHVLLADPRVDPTAMGSCCIRWACLNSELNVLQMLLADGRADPGSKGNRVAIRQAKATDSLDVLELLLSDVRVLKSLEKEDALLNWACRQGYIGIVRRFLNADCELCSTKKAMRNATNMKHTEIVELMLEDVRVRKELCFAVVDPKMNTPLEIELRAMPQQSARTFSLCVLRCEDKVALARMNDVMRVAFREFACLLESSEETPAEPHWRTHLY